MTHLADHIIMILYSTKISKNAKKQIEIRQFNLYVSQGTRTF